jgi:hypothetical protein
MDLGMLSEIFSNLTPEEIGRLSQTYTSHDALFDACEAANSAKVMVTAPELPVQLAYEDRETLHTLVFEDLRGQAGTEFEAALKTLLTIAKNLKDQPDEPKYRRLKCSNGKLRSTLLKFPASDVIMEVRGIQLIGFEKVLRDSEEGGEEEVYYNWEVRAELLEL